MYIYDVLITSNSIKGETYCFFSISFERGTDESQVRLSSGEDHPHGQYKEFVYSARSVIC